MAEQCSLDIQIKNEPVDDGYGDIQHTTSSNDECSDVNNSEHFDHELNMCDAEHENQGPSHHSHVQKLHLKVPICDSTRIKTSTSYRYKEPHVRSKETAKCKKQQIIEMDNVTCNEIPSGFVMEENLVPNCDIKSEPVENEGHDAQEINTEGGHDGIETAEHMNSDEEECESNFHSYSDYQMYVDSIEKGEKLPKQLKSKKKKKKSVFSGRRKRKIRSGNASSLQSVPYENLNRVEICTPLPGGKVLRMEKGVVRLEDNLYAEPMDVDEVFKSPYDHRSQSKSFVWRNVAKNAKILGDTSQSELINNMGSTDGMAGEMDGSQEVGSGDVENAGNETQRNEMNSNTRTTDVSDDGNETSQIECQDNSSNSSQESLTDNNIIGKKTSAKFDVVNQIFLDRKYNFKCYSCGRIFMMEDELEIHLKDVHGAISMHKCNKCDCVFNKYSLLCRHLQEHEMQSPHMCQYCDHEFDDRESLINHLVIHPEAKRFQCDLCLKWFKTRWTLKKHGKLHNDDGSTTSTYECPVCKYVFNRNVVKKHLQSVHPDELVTNTCLACGETFEVLTEFREHVKSKHVKCEEFLEENMQNLNSNPETTLS